MAEHVTDEGVLDRIKRLVDEEHDLLGHGEEIEEVDRGRLGAVRVELDQCWDLLRQRRARREFGDDPDQAEVRPAEVVESYDQ